MTETTAASVPAARGAVAGISLAVLSASSTWFAGASAAPVLTARWGLDASAAAGLTTATQAGFVFGTLLYAVLNLADRFPPRTVFALSAWLGALTNLGFAFAPGLGSALLLRLLTGLFLAGVYPVGMKLVAAWSPRGLGLRLGVMVGALTLGTAFPYFVHGLELGAPGRGVTLVASVAAAIGGLLVFAHPEGPHLPRNAPFEPRMIWRPFRSPDFRRNALGYFGHMVELYAFWSLLPGWLTASRPAWTSTDIQGLAAAAVGIGALGCIGGGLLSLRIGELRVARLALTISGLCCLTAPLWFDTTPWLATPLLLLWGIAVIADSPQFSALAARTCPRAYTGTALTVQNGIGFLITVLSIQTAAALGAHTSPAAAMMALGIGPVLGLCALRRGVRTDPPATVD